jgi:hypothetical protein
MNMKEAQDDVEEQLLKKTLKESEFQDDEEEMLRQALAMSKRDRKDSDGDSIMTH